MKEIELVYKRKPREKHFLQPDGTIVAKIFNDDIHYLKNNKYEEIDNTLLLNNNYYENKSNNYKVKFNCKDKASMNIKKDEYYISLELDKICNIKSIKNKNNSRFNSEVKYKNVFDNIDLDYIVLPNKVKETIILNKYSNQSIIFNIKTNLELIVDDKIIKAFDNDNNLIFEFDKPFMKDSKGEINYNVDYKLIKNGSNYKLKLVVDEAWLKSDNTLYPVYIDPTITNSNQTSGMHDTYIYEGDASANKSGESILKAGIERINGNDVESRTLLKFELPTIGTGSQIIDAQIVLTGFDSTGQHESASPKIVSIHKITSNWDETTATWSNMNDKYESKAEALIECERSFLNGYEITPHLMYGKITNLVKKWYLNEENNGIMIQSVSKEYIDDEYPAFYSQNNTVEGGNPKPILMITYRNQNGIEDYLDYKSQSFSEGNSYINTYNGNMTTVFNLGYTVGGQLPINLNLIYNTNDVLLDNKTFFGKGYKLNYEQIIRVPNTEALSDYLEYIDADGTIHYFYKDNDKYQDEDGLGLTLEKDEDECVIVDKNNNKMIFNQLDGIYYLSTIKDCNDNSIIIEKDSNNRIVKLKDSYDSEVTLSYEVDAITIISPVKNVMLNINNGVITSIESSLGETKFTYNENNLIETIEDIIGLKLNYEHYSNSPYRIKKVTQYGLNNVLGQYFNLDYGFETTRITDNMNKTETLIYNSYGNVISRNSLKSEDDIDGAYSLVQSYSNDGHKNNKILSSQIPTTYVKNYINNSSFESDEQVFTTSDDRIRLVITDEKSFIGNKSLKVECMHAFQMIEKTVSVPKGHYYTFSGYFQANDPVEIIISYVSSSKGEVKSSIELDSSLDFEKSDLTIFYSDDAITDIKLYFYFTSINVVYMDALQFEKGEIANLYNMIENSDFSDSYDGWELDVSDEYSNDIALDSFFSIVKVCNDKVNALKISMNPFYSTSLKKLFKVNGKKNSLYTISFWYKNEGVPNCMEDACNSVEINFYSDNERINDSTIVSQTFNCNDTIWQYYSCSFYAKDDFDEIEIVFKQNYQINDLYITNISMYQGIVSNFYDYDENGNLIKIQDQNENKNEFNYNNKNHLVNAIASNGENYYVEYDKENDNKIINVMSSKGIKNEIKYDDKGNPITSITTKKYSNEIVDGKYKIRNKGTNKYLKAELNMVLLEENECSNTIWNLINSNGRMKFIYSVHPTYSISHSEKTITLIKDGEQEFSLEKNINGSYKIYLEEDDKKLYVKANDVTIELAELIDNDDSFDFYIENNNKLFMQNDVGYDEEGRFSDKTVDSNFNSTQYTTNPITGQLSSVIDSNGVVTNYTYNEKGFLDSVSVGNRTLTYNYNDLNLLSEITLGNRKYKYVYDDFLNLKRVLVGDDIEYSSCEYSNNNGNLCKTIFGNDDEISYTYDEFGRIKDVIKQDSIYTCIYDNNGNISKVKSLDVTEKYDYDLNKRLVKYSYSNNNDYNNSRKFRINNVYNEYDEVINQTYYYGYRNSHSIEYQFDNYQVPVKCVVDNVEFNYEYDDINRLKKHILPNGYNIQYDYINNGNRVTELIKSITLENNKYSYQYDNLYNITHIYLNDQLINNYIFDEFNQLIKEINYNSNEYVEYNYDVYGNILSKTNKDLTTNEIIKTDSYEYNSTVWKDLLTSYNNESITYDSIGNPLTIGNNISLTWINGNNLNSYNDLSKDLAVSYKYNSNGLRVSKTVNGKDINYYYEGSNLIYEVGNKNLYYLYDATGLIGLEYSNEKYYYVKNLQNDIIGILNSAGEQIVTYEYDSWGKVLSVKDINGNIVTNNYHIGLINPFRYRSYYYDEETKLYYLTSRYYNPEWSRFINADTIINANKDIISFNLFTYGSNNPISTIDPSGHIFLWLLRKGTSYIGKKVSNYVKDKVVSSIKTINSIMNILGLGFSENLTIGKIQSTHVTQKGTLIEYGTQISYDVPIIGNSDNSTKLSNDGVEINKKYSDVKIDVDYKDFYKTGDISVGISFNNFTHNLLVGIDNGNIYKGYQLDIENNGFTSSIFVKESLNLVAATCAVVVAFVPSVVPKVVSTLQYMYQIIKSIEYGIFAIPRFAF